MREGAKMTLIKYVRVSSKTQHTDRQLTDP